MNKLTELADLMGEQIERLDRLTIGPREPIEKLIKILDCIQDANKRLDAMEGTKKNWERLGFFTSEQFAGLDKDIRCTQAAKLKLKRYFNKVLATVPTFKNL